MSKLSLNPFPQALSSLFETIDGRLKAGAPVFTGAPGSIKLNENQNGAKFYVRRYYLPARRGEARKQKDEYLGLETEVGEKVAELQRQIDEAKATQDDVRLLLREGFQKAAAADYATIATLHLNGLFAAGATLVGSHAYGTILNQLGFHAPKPYETEDIDIARGGTLAFSDVPKKNLLAILGTTGIEFAEVPENPSHLPSTSFKEAGNSRLRVDLLVPSTDDRQRNVPVPELGAHATALPYLAYLLGKTHMSTLLAQEGCCPVRVPAPERFALHKLLVSKLRVNMTSKSGKDVYQASAIIDVLGKSYQGAIEQAVMDLPVSALRYVQKAVPEVVGYLGEDSPGVEELRDSIARAKARGSKAKPTPPASEDPEEAEGPAPG